MNRGFTLVEVMIVIALIGIVGAMSLPAFNQMIANNRRVSAVNDMLSTLHIARSEAITRNAAVSICRSNVAQTACVSSGGGWNDGWLVFRDDDADGVYDADDDEILATGDGLPGNLDFESAEYANAMTFRASGRPNGTGGLLLLCETGHGTAVRSIAITRMGRPRSISEPGGDCA